MTGKDLPLEYVLTDDEARGITRLVDDLRADLDPAAHTFYDHAWPAIERLPHGFRRFLEDFRRNEPAAACVVRGFPVDDCTIGPTPTSWQVAQDTDHATDQEFCLALCAMVLGEPFTWPTLQAGRIIQNILPTPGDEQRQSGHGSSALLEFHTEDGFHPDRCDYLMLFGLRNHDRVPTVMSSVRDLRLPAEDRRLLTEERFHVLPDDEHVRQLALQDPNHPALATIRDMVDRPRPVAVLFGDRNNPYLRLDRPFMRCVGEDTRAEAALDRLITELQRVRQEVVVDAGTLLVVDNYLAVHGRLPFRARYDGSDRWLKKITVSRNLRKGLVHHEARDRRVRI